MLSRTIEFFYEQTPEAFSSLIFVYCLMQSFHRNLYHYLGDHAQAALVLHDVNSTSVQDPPPLLLLPVAVRRRLLW